MKKNRFTTEQIIGFIKQVEEGMAVARPILFVHQLRAQVATRFFCVDDVRATLFASFQLGSMRDSGDRCLIANRQISGLAPVLPRATLRRRVTH